MRKRKYTDNQKPNGADPKKVKHEADELDVKLLSDKHQSPKTIQKNLHSSTTDTHSSVISRTTLSTVPLGVHDVKSLNELARGSFKQGNFQIPSPTILTRVIPVTDRQEQNQPYSLPVGSPSMPKKPMAKETSKVDEKKQTATAQRTTLLIQHFQSKRYHYGLISLLVFLAAYYQNKDKLNLSGPRLLQDEEQSLTKGIFSQLRVSNLIFNEKNLKLLLVHDSFGMDKQAWLSHVVLPSTKTSYWPQFSAVILKDVIELCNSPTASSLMTDLVTEETKQILYIIDGFERLLFYNKKDFQFTECIKTIKTFVQIENRPVIFIIRDTNIAYFNASIDDKHQFVSQQLAALLIPDYDHCFPQLAAAEDSFLAMILNNPVNRLVFCQVLDRLYQNQSVFFSNLSLTQIKFEFLTSILAVCEQSYLHNQDNAVWPSLLIKQLLELDLTQQEIAWSQLHKHLPSKSRHDERLLRCLDPILKINATVNQAKELWQLNWQNLGYTELLFSMYRLHHVPSRWLRYQSFIRVMQSCALENPDSSFDFETTATELRDLTTASVYRELQGSKHSWSWMSDIIFKTQNSISNCNAAYAVIIANELLAMPILPVEGDELLTGLYRYMNATWNTLISAQSEKLFNTEVNRLANFYHWQNALLLSPIYLEHFLRQFNISHRLEVMSNNYHLSYLLKILHSVNADSRVFNASLRRLSNSTDPIVLNAVQKLERQSQERQYLELATDVKGEFCMKKTSILQKTKFGEFLEAVERGDAEAVRELVDKNPSLAEQVSTTSSRSGLSIAAKNDDAVMIKLLLEAKADPCREDDQRQTPRMIYNQQHHNQDICDLLEVTQRQQFECCPVSSSSPYIPTTFAPITRQPSSLSPGGAINPPLLLLFLTGGIGIILFFIIYRCFQPLREHPSLPSISPDPGLFIPGDCFPKLTEELNENKKIGKGSSATVFAPITFKPKYERFTKKVALKLYNPLTIDKDLKRATAECTTAFELRKSPKQRSMHVIDIQGVLRIPAGKYKNQYALVMESCDNSLKNYLSKKQGEIEPYKDCERYHFALDIIRGLQFLHDHKCLHRDIKTENILIKVYTDPTTNRSRLIAIIADLGTATPEHLTEGKIGGTPKYQSAEAKFGKPTKKSDIYSFGHVLRDLWPTVSELQSHENAQQIPKELDNLINCCFAHSPDDRPTLEEIKATLEECAKKMGIYERIDTLQDDDARPGSFSGESMASSVVSPPPSFDYRVSSSVQSDLKHRSGLTQLSITVTKQPTSSDDNDLSAESEPLSDQDERLTI